MKRPRTKLVWISLAFLLIASGCAPGVTQSPSIPATTLALPTQPPALDPTAVLSPIPPNLEQYVKAAPKVGCLAPDFSLKTLDGSTITLSDLRGKAVFINFWDFVCRYCQYEMPNIQYMHDTYSSQGLIVLGINNQNPQSVVTDYVRRMKMTFPVLLDSNGKVSKTYLVFAMPHSYFIDKEGLIQSIYIGELSRVEMEKRVQLVLK